jgi:hypothetical protein
VRLRPSLAPALLVALTLAGALDNPLRGQVRIPRVSPAASVSLDLGITNVRIDYHRPAVKGRVIWGGLVPYDAVWRMGANNATKLTVSGPFRVGGTELAAGSYALFAIPRADRWTILVNRKAEQWGAFSHDPKEDVARFDVVPRFGAAAVEWMSFTLTPAGEGKAIVELAWEKARVEFPIEVDVRKAVWSAIDAALAATPGDHATLLQAARYSAESGERVEEALRWIDAAMAAGESFWNYETKADLLHRLGRTAEALPLLDKAVELAGPAGAPQEYLDNVAKKKAAWIAAGRK